MSAFKTLAPLSLLAAGAAAFTASGNDNMAVYWGQNSYGAAGGAESGWQQSVGAYCQDDSIDIIPIAFLDVFYDIGNLPNLNLANICSSASDPVFPGSNLPNCSFLASDIQTCQSKGKILLLSLGGAGGGGQFTSADEASAFGTLIWDLFLGGTSDTRPFGSAVLDGIDLDIEGGGTTYFDSMVAAIQSAASGYSKKIYISGAPQCPYPDAYMGTVLNAASFDFVWPQFYNNYCAVSNYPSSWDFSDWDTWAHTVSKNPNVKIYIGALASSTAGSSGYASQSTVIEAAEAMQAQYSSFGGVMLWDASQAVANGNFQVGIKNALTAGSGSAPPSTSTTSTTSTTSPPSTSTTKTSTTTTTTTSSSGSGGTGCSGAAAWSSAIAYTDGEQVTYDGDLWTANQWNENEVPGGSSGAWTNSGACAALAAAKTRLAAAASASKAAVTKAAASGAAKSGAASPAASATAQAKATGSRFFRS